MKPHISHLLAAIFLIAVMAMTGCALTSPTLTREVLVGTNVVERSELRLRTYAIWPATIGIEKAKASAGKTLTFGADSAQLEGGGTNVAASLDALTRLLQSLPK